MDDAVVRRHVMLTMRLDLSQIDVRRFESHAARLVERGVSFSTLAERMADDPTAALRAYACHNECRRLQPPVELRKDPIPFDRWEGVFLTGEGASPELYFLASMNGGYIGACALEREAGRPGSLVCGFTGVLPAHTRQGVAQGLKAFCLLEAKRRGFVCAETSNLAVNRGICAVNRALGFRVVGRRVHSYPIPQ